MTMPPRAAARVLPPAPRRRDWALAGAAAGAFLAASELTFASVAGDAATPRLSAALGLGAVALVLAPAFGAGLVLRLLGRRPSHAALCGSLLGMLLAASPLGSALATALRGDLPGRGTLAALALAVLAGVAAARLGHRLESGGLALPGGTLLVAASLCVGAGQWMDEIARALGMLSIAVAFGAAMLIAALGAGLARRAHRQRSVSPAPWARTLVLAAFSAAIASLGPRVLPWILVDVTMPALAEGPPALLALDLGRLRAGEPAPLGLALLAREGVAFEVNDEADAPGALAALGLGPAADTLAARGYAAAVLLRDPVRAVDWPAPLVHVSPGPARWLERFAGRTAAGPLLQALGSERLNTLGLGARLRAARDVAAEASAWLVAWRSDRSHVPFALFVDLADDQTLRSEEAVDSASVELRDLLRQLSMDRRTLVLVVVARVGSDGERVLEVAISPPEVEGATPTSAATPVHVDSRALSTAISALPDVEPGGRVSLPGVGWTAETAR